MFDTRNQGQWARMGRLGALALTGLAIGACDGTSSSGSSAPQPTCDGTAASGSVVVSFSESPCAEGLSSAAFCTDVIVCQVTVINANAEAITVSLDSGSANVAPLRFDVASGDTMAQDVIYACPGGSPAAESGTLDVNVNLAGGPGAFCGADTQYEITVTP
jgi:hypothetical protein